GSTSNAVLETIVLTPKQADPASAAPKSSPIKAAGGSLAASTLATKETVASSPKQTVASLSGASGFAKFSSSVSGFTAASGSSPFASVKGTSFSKADPGEKPAFAAASSGSAASIKPFGGGGSFGGFGSAFGKKPSNDEDEEDAPDEDDEDGYAAQKKKQYEIQEVVNGEENEELIASAKCKLYTWQDETWKERGMGLLKISRIEKGKHRLVMRTSGVYKVILNVLITPGMPLNLRNENYIEFFAAEKPVSAPSTNEKPAGSSEKSPPLSRFLLKFKNGEVASKWKESMIRVIPTIASNGSNASQPPQDKKAKVE
ncbi:hypothetical protein HDU91_003872, partial [Kappamyces sp. JEL0680]